MMIMQNYFMKQSIFLLFVMLLFVPSMAFSYQHNKTHWVNIGKGTFDQGFLFPYKVKLYVPFGERDIPDIKNGAIAMRFQLEWLLKDASQDQVQKLFKTQIRDNYTDMHSYRLSKNLISFFLKKLPSIKKKDQWIFEYYPDAGTILYIKDKKIHHLVGAELNRALLDSWINKNPVLTNNLFTRLLKLQ